MHIFPQTVDSKAAFSITVYLASEFDRISSYRPTMGSPVVVRVCHLRTLFGTYERFVTHLSNDFLALYGCHSIKVYDH